MKRYNNKTRENKSKAVANHVAKHSGGTTLKRMSVKPPVQPKAEAGDEGIAQLQRITLTLVNNTTAPPTFTHLDEDSNYLEYTGDGSITLNTFQTVNGIILDMVTIAEDNRQKGYANNLMEDFMTNVVGASPAYLEVDPQGGMNPEQLQNWYANKWGFVLVGTSATGQPVMGINIPPAKKAPKKMTKEEELQELLESHKGDPSKVRHDIDWGAL